MLVNDNTAYGKRASYSQLYFPTAVAYDGWLYAFGTSAQELDQGGWIMRATAMETIPLAGDTDHAKPAPNPDPDPADENLPYTGDSSACIAWALLFIALASGIALLLVARRRGSESE